MNIILINHYAGSSIHGMEYRPFYLAREWVRQGHNVTIVAASQSHLHRKKPTINGNVTEEEIEGIRYVWLKTPEYQGNGASRVKNMLAFSWQLLRYQKNIIGEYQPQVVIASSPHPFIIYGARKLAKSTKAKLLFEVRDLWPLTLIELGGISTSHPFVLFMQWTENYAYKVAHRVVSLLPKADNYMQVHGMTIDKFVYIPNGIDISEWETDPHPLPDSHNATITNLRSQGKFLIGYAGTHGLANALDYLIDAAALIQETPVNFILVGEGSEKDRLQKKASALGLTNVEFLPPIEKKCIPTLLASMDALYIGWRKESLYRFGVSPNKLMDYMMAGKPVIHSIEAGNDLVQESGCGISVSPEDPKLIAQAVLEMMELESEQHSEMGLRGRKFIKANHDYRVLAKKFLGGL